LRTLRNSIFLALLTATGAAAAPGTAAEDAIPFPSLTESNRVMVQAVTGHYTLRRVYPAQEFAGQTVALEWMLDNLNATWALARARGLDARVTTLDAQGRMWTDDGDGSKGYVLTVYRQPGKRVYYMEGSQETFCTVRGRGVIVVDYASSTTNTVRFSGKQFIKVDHALMAAMTQLFRPFLTGMVDKAYRELLEPLRSLSVLATSQPGELRATMRKRPTEDQRQWEEFVPLLEPPAAPPR
jgi:hypothetical protein